MRLFIAINFKTDTLKRLKALCNELKETASRGNFSLEENLHLTLAFLGECDEKQKDAAKEALSGVDFEPFRLEIFSFGRFRQEKGDIWWAGIRESKELSELHKNLSARLKASGFILEKRKFSPHITLGREVATMAAPRKIIPFGEDVNTVNLMKSERIKGRITYTSIFEHRK
jgi:2'-5' RNA ligase